MLVTLDVMGVADDCMSSEVLDGFAYGKDGWSFSQAMALLFSGWIPAALKPLTKCSGWRLASHNCLSSDGNDFFDTTASHVSVL